jgi:hypothetical protein
MRGSLLGVGVVIGGLAVAAWALRDHPALAPWLARLRPPDVKLPAPTGTAARKCVGAGGQVVYTDDACPAGLREAPLAGGLSVLPAPKRALPAPPAASASKPGRGEAP